VTASNAALSARAPLSRALRKTNYLLAAAIVAFLCNAEVRSAEADADGASGVAGAQSDASGTELQEVVVNARKRQENAQSVPISIVTVSGDELQRSHAYLVGDIVQAIPSMNFQFINPRNTAFSIRGIGNNPANEGLENSVGLYLDGVYLSRPGMLTADLLDIDQIEVLRGPQGTLFGKNTTAGALSITTRGPEKTFGADAEVSAGDYDFLQEKVDVTGPLSSSASGRLAAFHTGRDGTIEDTTNGSKLNNQNQNGVRGQLLLAPTDAFSLRLIADYSHQNEESGAQVLVNPGLTLANGAPRPNNVFVRSARFDYVPVFDPFARKVAIDEPQTIQTTNQGLSAEANWKLGDHTLTSISAWRSWQFYPTNDLDYLPLQLQETGGGNVWNKQLSEELRIASPTGQAVDYVAGAYVFWQDVRTQSIPGPTYGTDAAEFYSSPSLILPSYALNGLTTTTQSDTATRSYALFGQETWHISPAWSWTTGLRSTYDDKSAEVLRSRSGGAPLSVTDPYYAAATKARNSLAPPDASAYNRATGNTVSGMSSLSYAPMDKLLLYATFARGAKSGGLNTSIIPPGANPIVSPEIAYSAELGVKSTLDGTLQLNFDVFWTHIDDYQTTVRDPILNTSYLANAAGVRSLGAEVNATWLPLDGLRFDSGVAYDDAIYTSFSNSPCGIEYSGIATICNLTGKPVSGAPRWTANVRGEYSHVLGSASIRGYGGAEYNYRSSNFYTSDDSSYALIPGYGLVNLHLGLRSNSGSWDASLWVRNALNKDYFTALNNPSGGVFATGYIVGSIGDPRTFGATVIVHF
jgi:iron complex outermembrane receptor protein